MKIDDNGEIAPTENDWIKRFREAPSERRKAMCEALAWTVKHWSKTLLSSMKGNGSPEDLLFMEDLAVFSVCAFFEPKKRDELVAQMLPLIATMATDAAQAETSEEHQKVHDTIRRAVDRISAMSYDEDPDKPHPFADEPTDGD
ncbi:MAG: hypothetical protein ACYDDA_05280 [Acidiferrobacteraceae bacterium]